jgi:hypothetical protein
MNRFLPLVAALLLASCAAAPSPDPALRIRIANAGTQPLQCRVMFGHWVDRDLGLVTANEVSIAVQQQPRDGALYVLRDDGRRRMMVENIYCAQPGNWQATVGQMDLAVVRRQRPKDVSVRCALPAAGGRVTCSEPNLR